MLDEQVTITYRELIDAFTEWSEILAKGYIPTGIPGDTVGELGCNFLLATINKNRKK
jgi:hypothetical protein